MTTGHSILVIDDNDDERQIYTTLLFHNGYDVAQAKSAEEGITLARSKKFSAILMDIRMRGLNGLVATEILSAMPDTSGIPVLCITGFDISAERAARSGAAGLLRKPVPADVLIKSVRDLIERPPHQTPG